MELVTSDNLLHTNTGLIDKYCLTRCASLQLCQPLSLEDYIVQPSSEVSPPKWHLAHTTWFFEQFLLKKYFKDYKEFSPHFDYLFNSYYKTHGKHWQQSERGQLSRPTVGEILTYREYVDEQIQTRLNSTVVLPNDITSILITGLEHEKQHQELLLMDIKYILSRNCPSPAYSDKVLEATSSPSPSSTYAAHSSGIYWVGQRSDSFSYDNEKPRHRRFLEDFEISHSLVTNGEYLDFIEDGGYKSPSLWLSKGWDWKEQNNIQMPLYWYKENDLYMEYTLHGSNVLALASPVCHVSYFEAQAFAKWSGQRLPTEEEAEVYLDGHDAHLTHDARISQTNQIFHPTTSNTLSGQLWFWTQSHYSPYPGYMPYDGSLAEYNSKFMCNQFVLRGGSFATPAEHYRNSYRNFYEPHQRWMFSGIRLARSRDRSKD